MQKDKLKGGKSDKLSVEDIAKKHSVSIASIKKQIEMGIEVEHEHVNDKKLAEEIAMDHLEEIPDYYTRLKTMEKEAKKELNLESKRFMALAGIKEGDKKFLTNESFQQDQIKPVPDITFNGSIYQKDKTTGEWKNIDTGATMKENKKDDDDFIVFELEQKDFKPGQDDGELYKLG